MFVPGGVDFFFVNDQWTSNSFSEMLASAILWTGYMQQLDIKVVNLAAIP